MKPYFLIYVCLLTSFLGCRKPNPPYLISQELKDYVFFEQGSKWIYQQQNTQNKDTSVVTEKTRSIESLRESLETSEQLVMKRKSSFHNDSFFTISDGFFRAEATNTNETNDYYITQPYVSRMLFFSGKPVGYRKEISQGTYTDYVSQHPTYTVAGKEYTDVREYFSVLGFENPTTIDPRLPNRVWYARHVGIIKKQLPNGEVWELIHHEVTQ